MQDWIIIDLRFLEEVREGLSYEKVWQDLGLTYEVAEEWIGAGWKVEDYQEIINWRKHYFNAKEARYWRERVMTASGPNYALAVYLSVNFPSEEKIEGR